MRGRRSWVARGPVARNSIHIETPRAAVWSVLDDPSAYPRWIVGTDRTLAAEPGWPEPGSAFTVRLPFGFTDRTEVEELDTGRRLVLDAAAGIFGPARVTIELFAEDGGTRLTMVEDPSGKFTLLRAIPLVHLGLRVRNAESLRRLRALVLRRAAEAA